MNVLYGVNGEGLGHAMRSAVVGEYLEARGHRVTFCSSGRALKYLESRFPGCTIPIVGAAAVMRDNRVSPGLSLARNAGAILAGLPTNLAAVARVNARKPQAVITDFEPFTASYARVAGLRCVAVDNIHFMNRCTHPREFVQRNRTEAALMHPVAENCVRSAERYIVTTFVGRPVCKPNTTLHLPILRQDVLRSRSSRRSDHVVVYFNGKANHASRIDTLRQLRGRFRVYGIPGQSRETTLGNVTLCPFSDSAFIRDAATAQAAISGAGFTVISEAIYLGTPLLAVPFEGHFEQILNAEYVQAMGYGERCCGLSGAGIAAFLARAPAYRRNLQTVRHDGNHQLLQSVESAIHGLPGHLAVSN